LEEIDHLQGFSIAVFVCGRLRLVEALKFAWKPSRKLVLAIQDASMALWHCFIFVLLCSMDVVDVFNVVIIHATMAKDTELQISSPVQAICADIGVI
jgi:hypothetical protein